MKKYLFKEQKIDNEYKYIFLCGSKFSANKSDKRVVLREFLHQKDCRNRAVILEDNFIFSKSIVKNWHMMTYI